MSWKTSVLQSLIVAALTLSVAGCGRKDDKTSSDLIRDLKNSNEAVRIQAAAALSAASHTEAKEAVPALSEALKDKSPYVRKAAVESLGALGSDAQAAIPSLKTALKDSDQGVRLEADEALKKIQGK